MPTSPQWFCKDCEATSLSTTTAVESVHTNSKSRMRGRWPSLQPPGSSLVLGCLQYGTETVELIGGHHRLLVVCRGIRQAAKERAHEQTGQATSVREFAECESKAQQGRAEAQVHVGLCLRFGIGGAAHPDEAAAVQWYRRAAEQGDAVAQFNLAGCYHGGIGVPADPVRALEWCRKAAMQGLAEAQNYLAFGLDVRDGVRYGTEPTDQAETPALWYFRAAAQNHAHAQYNMATCWFRGVGGVTKDAALAVKWLRQAAAAHQCLPQAQYRLGLCLATGTHVPKDEAAAMATLRPAAEQLKHAPAQHLLGRLLFQTPAQQAAAVNWYRQAAHQGHVEAQVDLAACLQTGVGTHKDAQEAVAWLRRAAAQKDATAQQRLAQCLFDGVGTDMDRKTAAQYYSNAAEAGCAEAQYMLGQMLRVGQDVAQDTSQAVAWYRRAALQNHALAQLLLAQCLAVRVGPTLSNEVEAQRWLRRSATLGLPQAQYELGVWLWRGEHRLQRDSKQALAWLHKAAERHYVPAANLIGWIMECGGIEAMAMGWYQRAAERGDPYSMHHLAFLLENGVRGLPPNLTQAAYWRTHARSVPDSAMITFLLAETVWNAHAQYRLAWMMEHGRGMKADATRALALWRQAAAAGHAKAAARLTLLAGRTTWTAARSEDSLLRASSLVGSTARMHSDVPVCWNGRGAAEQSLLSFAAPILGTAKIDKPQEEEQKRMTADDWSARLTLWLPDVDGSVRTEYVQKLMAEGIGTLHQLRNLTHEDFRMMGFKVGHRISIQERIR